MSVLELQSRPQDGTNYYVCDGTEVSFYPLLLTQANPSPVQRTLISAGGTIAAGATTLTLTTASTSKLWDGQRIVLPNNQVIAIDASAQALDPATGTYAFPVGATAIKIYPPSATITMPGSVPYTEFQPFFSCDTASFKANGTIVEFKNFRAGPFAVKKKAKLDSSFMTDGFTTRIDPMLQMVRSAALDTNAFILIRYIQPDGYGAQFTAQVSSLDMSTKDGDPLRSPFEYAVGVPVLGNYALS